MLPAGTAGVRSASKHGKIPKQRKDTDNYNDGLDDLLGASIQRQPVDEVENQNDNQKSDQNADQYRHVARALSLNGLVHLTTMGGGAEERTPFLADDRQKPVGVVVLRRLSFYRLYLS